MEKCQNPTPCKACRQPSASAGSKSPYKEQYDISISAESQQTLNWSCEQVFSTNCNKTRELSMQRDLSITQELSSPIANALTPHWHYGDARHVCNPTDLVDRSLQRTGSINSRHYNTSCLPERFQQYPPQSQALMTRDQKCYSPCRKKRRAEAQWNRKGCRRGRLQTQKERLKAAAPYNKTTQNKCLILRNLIL